MNYAEECKCIADSIRDVDLSKKRKLAAEYYTTLKPLIKENANNGLYYYTFHFTEEYYDPLIKIIEEDGFVVDAQIVRNCGIYSKAIISIEWK